MFFDRREDGKMREMEENDVVVKEPCGDVDDLIFCKELDWMVSDR